MPKDIFFAEEAADLRWVHVTFGWGDSGGGEKSEVELVEKENFNHLTSGKSKIYMSMMCFEWGLWDSTFLPCDMLCAAWGSRGVDEWGGDIWAEGG